MLQELRNDRRAVDDRDYAAGTGDGGRDVVDTCSPSVAAADGEDAWCGLDDVTEVTAGVAVVNERCERAGYQRCIGGGKSTDR